MGGKGSLEKDGSTLRSKMREKILLIDSSVLMLPMEREGKSISLDTLEEVSEGRELSVLDTTVKELEKIRKHKGKKGKAADLALELIKKMDIQVIATSDKTREKAKQTRGDFFDQVLLFAAENLDTWVATTDLELKRRLRERGIKVIYLRGKKRFNVDGK